MQAAVTTPLRIMILFLSMSQLLFAQQDLDVERARRQLDTQAAEASRAKADYDRATQRLQADEAALAQAKREESQARSQLANTERQLQGTESNITNLERQIIDLQRQVAQLNNDLQSQRSDLQEIKRRYDHLHQRVRHLNQEVNGIDADIARLSRDAEANRDQIEQLKQRKERLVQELQREKSDLSRAESELDNADRQVQRTQQSIANRESDIASKRNDVSSLERLRTRQLNDINFYRSEISRATTQIRDCERDVALADAEVRTTKSTYQREDAELQSAQRYLEQVEANYNRELQTMLARADTAAKADAKREADQRAPTVGDQSGRTDGMIGAEHGRTDGELVSFLSGYREARQSPQLNPTAFQQGIEKGYAAADQKAHAEDFPDSYNRALANFLTRVPDREETYDLTGEATFPSGEASPELAKNNLTVGQISAPAFPIAADPVTRDPGVVTPRINIPEAPLGDAPCTGLILAEFEPKCRARYRDTFVSTFRDEYSAQYLLAYRKSYAEVYRNQYTLTRSVAYPDSQRAGVQQGAQDQGILNGFAQRLPTARATAQQQGTAALNSKTQESHLVFVRSVRLKDRDANGVLSPGEPIDLDIVVDNIAAKPTPDQHLKLKIQATSGLANIAFEFRDLPSIPGNTRLNLHGVTTVTGSSVYSGDSIRVKGDLLNREGLSAHQFSIEQVLRYALELNNVTLAKDPAVGEEVDAKLTFVNQSQINSTTQSVSLSVAPKFADISVAAPIEIPELAPGEEFVASAKIKPGLWVGENTFVNIQAILSQLTDPAATLMQPFKKFIHINRHASVLLFDRNNIPLESSRMVVTAGSTIAINASMKYHSNVALPGPFVLKSASQSHPSIVHPSNSTISVNYGSWSPTRAMPTATFQYVVPASLKGQAAWVMLQLVEGNNNIHAPMVYLDVK